MVSRPLPRSPGTSGPSSTAPPARRWSAPRLFVPRLAHPGSRPWSAPALRLAPPLLPGEPAHPGSRPLETPAGADRVRPQAALPLQPGPGVPAHGPRGHRARAGQAGQGPCECVHLGSTTHASLRSCTHMISFVKEKPLIDSPTDWSSHVSVTSLAAQLPVCRYGPVNESIGLSCTFIQFIDPSIHRSIHPCKHALLRPASL